MPATATMFEATTYSASGSFSDPGGSGWIARVNYGDGSGAHSLALSGLTFSLQHAYAEVCTCRVTVTVANVRGGSGSGSTTATVVSAPPVVSVAPGGLAVLGHFVGSGSYSDADPGADSFSATVSYGDGTGPRPLVLNGGHFSLSHTYGALLHAYTVTVTITDDDGVAGRATTTVAVL